MKIFVVAVSPGLNDGIAISFELCDGDNKAKERFLISDEDYQALSISVGETTRELYDAVEYRSKLYQAYKHGGYLLGFSDSSKIMLRRKLAAKGFDAEISRKAVQKLEDDGWLCEEDSAKREAEKCAEKLWGEARISNHLAKKGYLGKVQAKAILSLKDAGVDFDKNCRLLLEKKYSPIPNDKKEKQKIISALLRYGYSLSQIKCALRG